MNFQRYYLDESPPPIGAMQCNHLAHPPDYFFQGYRRHGFSPMSWAEARHWIASFNAWVETWNSHERDIKLPLSPEWPDAHWLYMGRPRSVFAFIDKGTERTGFMRVDGYRHYHKGWSFCRNPIDPDKVTWGGWFTEPEYRRTH